MRRAKTADGGEWELPDLPVADDRALRRAIRRGVLRTAAVGAVYLLFAAIVVSILAQLLLAALHRQAQLDRIATAWQVAHPEYTADTSGSGGTWLGRYVSIDARLFTEPTDPGAVSVKLSQDLLGRVHASTSLPQSPAFDALRTLGGPEEVTDKAAELRQLKQLPTTTSLSAIVSFTRPLDEDGVQRWAAAFGPSGFFDADTFLMTAANPTFTTWNGVVQSPVYGWSAFRYFHEDGSWTTVSSFRRWVGELHDSDASNLHRMGLDLGRLRTAAREGLMHGMILTGATPAELAKVLQTPEVRAVHTYNIAFSSIP